MKSLVSYVKSSTLVAEDSLEKQLLAKINEARAYLPKREITARDALAQRVQDLKYLSKLSKIQRDLL